MSHPPFDSDYEMIRSLGRGTFGAVWLARRLSTDEIVAVKVFKYKEIALRESEILKLLPLSVHLPRYIDLVKNNFLVTNYIPGEELYYAYTKYIFTPDMVHPMLIQMVETVKLLHDHHIIHRDIKLENIMYDINSRNLVLIDFDAAYHLDPGELVPRGTPGYVSPVLVQAYINYKKDRTPLPTDRRLYEYSDIFALGVVFFIITEECYPWKEWTHSKAGYDVYDWSSPVKPTYNDNKLVSIIQLMLQSHSTASNIIFELTITN